jgi:hypothetical protein
MSALTGISSAGTIAVVDQSQTLSTEEGEVAIGLSVAQGFVPTLSGLNVVELMLIPDSGTPTTLAVNIRSGSPTGTILGTSNLMSVPSGGGIIDFDFTSTVPLSPGSLYYIQFTPTGPTNLGVFEHQQGPDAYPPGVLSIGGAVATNNPDAFFVEGLSAVVAPEPGTMGLAAFALLAGSALVTMRLRKIRS